MERIVNLEFKCNVTLIINCLCIICKVANRISAGREYIQLINIVSMVITCLTSMVIIYSNITSSVKQVYPYEVQLITTTILSAINKFYAEHTRRSNRNLLLNHAGIFIRTTHFIHTIRNFCSGDSLPIRCAPCVSKCFVFVNRTEHLYCFKAESHIDIAV